MKEKTDVDRRVDQVMEDARGHTSSDPLVHIVWLINGLDLHHRSGGKVGYTLEETQRYAVSSILNRFGESQ